jgi:cellulose synthase/poly-beta-1,6-N-acetylglucosamine synthase-like glycosyltransferase
MEILFWVSAFFLLYPYAGYPLLLWLIGRVQKKTATPPAPEPRDWPALTLLIAAYNEEAVIGEKLENSLALDYPPDRLEIVVASESTDRTNEIAGSYRGRGVKLYAFRQRRGKPALLYSTVPLARGEIVIFSDANALYEPQALKKLARHFADPRLGCVSGQLVYDGGAGAAAAGESLYWRYEQWLKRLESRLGALLGANGSLFALRKSLYAPLSETRGDDFELPVRVLLQGYRAILDPEARSHEQPSGSVRAEYRRRVRIVSWFLASARQLLGEAWRRRRLLLAVQLLSHRLLRWAAPLFLLLLLGSCAGAEKGFYRAALAAQLVFYGAALLGWRLEARRASLPLLLRLPYCFCAIHVAMLVGLGRGLSAPGVAAWEKVR